MHGRIWFPGNPWLDGHRVTEFAWTGRLDGDGRLWFDLSLETELYDDSGEPAATGSDDFGHPDVWRNYHACSLSSTRWEESTGVLAATPRSPFRLADALPRRLTADSLPIVDLDAPPAFHVYLLGHDSVADHEIVFTRQETGGHAVDWNGRIALTYAGEEEYSHRFRAHVGDVVLDHVTVPDAMRDADAHARLAEVIELPELFTLSDVDGRRAFVRTGP